MKNTTTSYSVIKSPVGELLLTADDSALTGVYFAGCNHVPAESKQWTRNPQHPVLQSAAKQLAEYFAGKRTAFSISLHPSGTDFQEKVWREIARIPYGKTVSYSHLAKRAGTPDAVRAAGTATGRNPLSIVIPCHRVVGKNGALCGFAGGLERKQYLHTLEGLSAKPATTTTR
ncbi:MAG TPA: methylated-DNA--[protein]-cysteine S-methyltransferase [Candidatus Acidoferrales bacterium]|nr:methylated-DNA--[protein]-cysteine S-methyltransferase [Candidatus Acidoferrales bacterium]